MRLLLVDNLILPESGSLATLDVHPHLGLLALAATAKHHGHEVRIYDPKRLLRAGRLPYDETLYERVAAELLRWSPQAVGFTTLGCSFLFALNVAALLKRREPDLPILLGGPHATMLHQAILERFPQFDIVARHECDEILPALLDSIESRDFNPIPGLSWRDGQRLCFTAGKPKVDNLDALPLTDYDHYPIAELGLDLLRIEAGRGCPFACTFCSTAGFFQRSFRLKSAERLVAELDRLHDLYGVRDFKLDHDMFTVNRHKVLDFCAAVRGRGYRWRASARVDCVDESLLEAMADAGCVNLYFGIETGSARMQAICRKRLDLELVDPILQAADRMGIETTASFITGYPEETEADQDETLDMIGRLNSPRCLTQLHILAPEPGTPLLDQHGDTLSYDGYGGPYNTDLIGADDQTLVRDHPAIFSTYYYYPASMPRWRYVFATEGVAMLRRLGPLALAYLLRIENGSLSALLRDWRQFAHTRSAVPAATAAALQAYVSHRLGLDHHAVSLVKYALCVHAGGNEKGASPAPPQNRFDPLAIYRLHEGARILSDLHDCEAVLRCIRADTTGSALLDDEQFPERRSYLLLRRGEKLSSWTIDPGVAAILQLFEQPRQCATVRDWVQDMSGDDAVGDDFFAALAREQILVMANVA